MRKKYLIKKSLAFIGLLACLNYSAVYAHFALAPKIEVGPLPLDAPDKELLHVDELRVSRADFADHLQRITAFDTKYDRVQTVFFSYFELIRGIVLFHPDNVHKYIDNIAQLESQPQFYHVAVSAWFKKQADMFSRIRYYTDKAKRAGADREKEVRAVLDFYSAGAKTEFLEELIVLGSMAPSVAGLEEFLQNVAKEQRSRIDTGLVDDTEVTPFEEQERMKKRWLDFRHDVLKRAEAERQCANLPAADAPADTVIAKINQHELTLGDYLAVFDKPPLPRQWKAVAEVNCNRLVLFYAMADIVDRYDIHQERVKKKIDASRDLYLAARQIVRDLGTGMVDPKGESDAMSIVRVLMVYPKVVDLKTRLLENTQQLFASADLYLDNRFLSSVDWTLKRTLAPKHSIHF